MPGEGKAAAPSDAHSPARGSLRFPSCSSTRACPTPCGFRVAGALLVARSLAPSSASAFPGNTLVFAFDAEPYSVGLGVFSLCFPPISSELRTPCLTLVEACFQYSLKFGAESLEVFPGFFVIFTLISSKFCLLPVSACGIFCEVSSAASGC